MSYSDISGNRSYISQPLQPASKKGYHVTVVKKSPDESHTSTSEATMIGPGQLINTGSIESSIVMSNSMVALTHPFSVAVTETVTVPGVNDAAKPGMAVLPYRSALQFGTDK